MEQYLAELLSKENLRQMASDRKKKKAERKAIADAEDAKQHAIEFAMMKNVRVGVEEMMCNLQL